MLSEGIAPLCRVAYSVQCPADIPRCSVQCRADLAAGGYIDSIRGVFLEHCLQQPQPLSLIHI